MLFNSFEFLLFFPLALIGYYFSGKWRIYLLLVASYIFYMSWNPAYIFLILASTLIDYFAAIKLYESQKKWKRKFYLGLSLASNLGILFFFKYYDFVTGNVVEAINDLGGNMDYPRFSVLLPVGISFYTFQTLSYTIDIYRNRINPEKHFATFALYVSFFPQLVAGPIERSERLIPQLKKKNKFSYGLLVSGLRLMLLGFFKKIVVADRLAVYVNEVYGNVPEYNALNIVIATLFFAFQIFCDFSGYSDIAIGAARTMGIDLMKNFERPYFSKSISEFWKRWHISLSTWFRDYLYIPLGGNRVVMPVWFMNLMITFLVSGLWHGANWTFVAWGGLHGAYLVTPLLLTKGLGIRFKWFPNNFLIRFVKIIFVFILVDLAWIFFRANSITDAFMIYEKIFATPYNFPTLDNMRLHLFGNLELVLGISMIFILLGFEFLIRRKGLDHFYQRLPEMGRFGVYFAFLFSIIFLGHYSSKIEFIYFQF